MRSILPPWPHTSKPRFLATRGLGVGYWAAVALLAVPVMGGAGFTVGPPWTGVAWVLLNLVAAAAIGTGVVRNAPSRRWPWAVIAVATILWAIADEVYEEAENAGRIDALAIGELLYIVGFIGLTAALLQLRRSDSNLSPNGRVARPNGLAPAGLLDTLTVTLLLLLLIWVTVIGRAEPDAWSLVDPTLVAYPIGDALLVATALRLVIVGPANPSVWSLIVAAGAFLGADLAHSLGASDVTGSLSLVEDLGGLIAAACLGWAALHPSMARLTEPEPAPPRELTLRRFWVVALTALVAPVVLLAQAVTGDVRDGVMLAVLGTALTLVALARVAATGNSQSRSLVFRAWTDTLTGLPSRAHLMRRLAEGADPPWSAVLLVDLDQFRAVNEDAGPSVGDAVLVTLAERLRRLGSADDIVARFGGDEFAILVGGPRDATALTVDVVAATTEPMVLGGRTVTVSACVGVAVAPDSGSPAGEEMVRRAGMALRAAKEAGPGEWCRYDSDRHVLLIERLRLRESLSRAVDEGAFLLSYQPIVALATGETVGFEALVRWAHPTRGVVAPSEFIAVAEETGLIEAIGDLVLRTAVAEAVGWRRPDVYVSVNVSPRQLRRPGFAERVEEVLTASGLPADRLMLELTETTVTRGSDHVWAELEELRNRGVRLAIDDFGTGFSSLSYLEQTPIGAIKMDKSFVDSLVVSERQRTVVDGIVSMAHKLGLQVVAEGIESAAERDLLAQMRCPYGQGYLYSHPLTSTEVIGWLARPTPAVPAPRRAAVDQTDAPAEVPSAGPELPG